MRRRTLLQMLPALAAAAYVPGQANATEKAEAWVKAVDRSFSAGEGLAWTMSIIDRAGRRSELHVLARQNDFLAEFTGPKHLRGRRVLRRQGLMWVINPDSLSAGPVEPSLPVHGAAAFGDLAPPGWAEAYEPVSMRKDGGFFVIDLRRRAGWAVYPRVELRVNPALRRVDVADLYLAADALPHKSMAFSYIVTAEGLQFPQEITITDADGATKLSVFDIRPISVAPAQFLLENAIAG